MAQKYHLQINYWRLLLIALIVCIVSVVLCFVLAAYEENSSGTEMGLHITKVLFTVMDFPAIVFFNVMFFSGWPNLIAAIIASALFDALIVEILILLWKRYKSKT